MVATTKTGMWGLRSDRAPTTALAAVVGAAAVTFLYWLAARVWFAGSVPTHIELFGTMTSLACVWLTRRQNVLCMPLGIVSVIAMGWFFFDIELVGQGWLHLGFYVPIQFVAWRVWLRGTDGERPVSRLTNPGRLAVVGGAIILTLIGFYCFQALHGDSGYLWWDTSVVAASVTAQLLLNWKKVESWWFWIGPVDVSAVGLYLVTGAYLFAALYALYIVIATGGLIHWRRSLAATAAGADAVTARLGTGTLVGTSTNTALVGSAA